MKPLGVLLVAAALGGCFGSEPPSPGESGSRDVPLRFLAVVATDNVFSPSEAWVYNRATVTFRNAGSVAHTGSAPDFFETGVLRPGASISFTLLASGDVEFICGFHSGEGMRGILHVAEETAYGPRYATP